MQYIIDTNIFLRVLIKEEKKSFQSSVAILKAIKENKCTAIVPGVVLAEIAWTLASYYKFPKSQVVEALEGILNLRGITLRDDYDYRQAINLFQNFNVKYIDACIASLPAVQKGEAIIVSYDLDFDKLGIQRKEPDNLSL